MPDPARLFLGEALAAAREELVPDGQERSHSGDTRGARREGTGALVSPGFHIQLVA